MVPVGAVERTRGPAVSETGVAGEETTVAVRAQAPEATVISSCRRGTCGTCEVPVLEVMRPEIERRLPEGFPAAEKARLEARVEELEDQLGRAVVIEGHSRTQVDLGATVTLKSGSEALRVQLVSPVEVEVASEPPHISDASPLGKALLGRKVGDTFRLEAGGRSTDYEVTGID